MKVFSPLNKTSQKLYRHLIFIELSHITKYYDWDILHTVTV